MLRKPDSAASKEKPITNLNDFTLYSLYMKNTLFKKRLYKLQGIILTLLFLHTGIVLAQCEKTGLIGFESREDIEKYNKCDSVFGDITISFSSIREMKETDFPNLVYVSGLINIAANDSLKSIKGFNKLNNIESIQVNSNPKLETFTAFENVTKVGRIYFRSHLSKTMI